MGTKLGFERVGRDNFDEFFAMVLKLAEFERLTPPDRKAKARMKRHATQARPYYEAYIGRLGGTAVGYTIFFLSYSSFVGKPTLYVEDVFVLEEHRHQGFGRRFFDFLFKQAAKRDCGRMEWCALDWNRNAVEFYEKLGARKLSEWIYFRVGEERIKKPAV